MNSIHARLACAERGIIRGTVVMSIFFESSFTQKRQFRGHQGNLQKQMGLRPTLNLLCYQDLTLSTVRNDGKEKASIKYKLNY